MAMTPWPTRPFIAFVTACTFDRKVDFLCYWWWWWWRRRRRRRLDHNALDKSTSFAEYFSLDLFRRAAHHSDCHRVFLLNVDLALDFYCSLTNPENLATFFGPIKNNSYLALFLKRKIKRLTRDFTQYFLDFLVAFFAS